MNYLSQVYKELSEKYHYQPEFLQAVESFFESIDEVVSELPNIDKNNLIRRMIEPDRIISFKVVWENDQGNTMVNKGYRVQFNQAIGPYKGGNRFHPSVNESIMKFLAFEQTFKNALTGIPMGGAKGGSDFDPSGKSQSEIKRFVDAFMLELYKYIGPDIDIPGGDIGVSRREIGYMFGAYKKITGRHNGSFTGKGISYGGSLGRTEATGYGLCYIAEAALKKYKDTNLSGKRVIVSGSGIVGWHAAFKAQKLGANVVAISSIDGVINHESGIDLNLIKQLNEQEKTIDNYLKTHPTAKFNANPKSIWEIKTDIAFPCATQNELDLEDVKKLHKNGLLAVFEGANMPTETKAVEYLINNKILFTPGKASNAGGVMVSGFEMAQNATFTSWSEEEVLSKLKKFMYNIFDEIYEVAQKHNNPYDLVKGANIASFIKIYDAMKAQGL